MKRIISVLVVMLVALSFVFANGGKESTSDNSSKKTLKVAMECGYAP